MTEIKPIYQIQQLGEWIEVDKSIFDEIYIQNKFPHRILYPASAYEALQKEVTHWKANHADLKERLHVATHRTDLPSDRLPLFDKMKAEIAALQKENAELKRNHKFTCENLANTVPFIEELEQKNAAQAKQIAELESELVEWNEFKKIRDTQMQSLRKQLP